MIQLKNVSKFYYSKGMIASGISKVSLNFDIGEFVVITGESGSGKTTLLNVISGLDSYEEGEMYIDGKETSHYVASDFEEYRKKYIGNIFQEFNLINSYTVYQNIELILLINGYSREQIKKRAPHIIERVGLASHAKAKVSKLSGGQKQRVAIARALAKDTDIIVADEPTGNLDSVSAEGIAQLLSEISRDKLVIVVTHNYQQFEPYATREIKMHDGKVAEDKPLRTAFERINERVGKSTDEQTASEAAASAVRDNVHVADDVANTEVEAQPSMDSEPQSGEGQGITGQSADSPAASASQVAAGNQGVDSRPDASGRGAAASMVSGLSSAGQPSSSRAYSARNTQPNAERKGGITEGHDVGSASIGAQRTARHRGDITAGSKIKLGIRNTFNIIPKFVLLLVVFLFIIFAVTSQYTTLQHQEAEEDKLGYNNYFYNYKEDRVVLKKIDNSEFTADDFNAIRNVSNVESVVADDIMLDSTIYIEEEDFSYETYPRVLGDFSGTLAAGRMPEAENEAILTSYKNDYDFNDESIAELLNKTYKVSLGEDKEIAVTIVGCAYKPESDEYDYYMYTGDLFITDQLMNTIRKETYNYNSTVTTTINGKEQQYQEGNPFYRIVPNSRVAAGTALAFEDMNNFYEKGKAKGQVITVTAENLYYTQSVNLQIADLYNKKTFTAKSGISDYDMHNGTIYVNQADYDALFMKGNYQATVYVSDVEQMDETLNAFETMGYVTLPLKETLIQYMSDIGGIIKVPMAVILTLAVFLIAYFVIRLILKSRAVYFTILRMLGMARRNIRRVMDVEMLLVSNIAYGIFLVCVALVKEGYIKVQYIMDLIQYLRVIDYVALYIIILLMAYLISGKFVRSLFKKTAMGTYREGDK